MTQLRGQLNGCRPNEPEPGNTGGGKQEVNTTNRIKIKSQMDYKNPKVLAEVAIFTALAVVLSIIPPIFEMPQGGSVTLVMVPIIWLALRRGPKVGIGAGILFGVIHFMFKSYAVSPFQVFFDYPLAFGVLGLAAFFPNRPIVGTSIATAGRFLMHFIAGAVWWAPIYASGANPIVYSSIYNGIYLLPELVISGVLLYLLQKKRILKAYM
jgi:thiamine transporter